MSRVTVTSSADIRPARSAGFVRAASVPGSRADAITPVGVIWRCGALGPDAIVRSGRLVPIELVDATGGEIRLRCSLAEFSRLEPAEEADLAEVADYGGYGSAAAVQGYGGMGIGMGLGYQMPVVVSHAVPLGETEVERHESVHAVDGEIGRVEGFVMDTADHKVTHVLLQEGHMWGRQEVAIPISAVASVDAGIWLNITKKQVEDLPPLGPGHP